MTGCVVSSRKHAATPTHCSSGHIRFDSSHSTTITYETDTMDSLSSCCAMTCIRARSAAGPQPASKLSQAMLCRLHCPNLHAAQITGLWLVSQATELKLVVIVFLAMDSCSCCWPRGQIRLIHSCFSQPHSPCCFPRGGVVSPLRSRPPGCLTTIDLEFIAWQRKWERSIT